MDFQKVPGASLAEQLIDVSGDDYDLLALLVQPGLTLGDGEVPRVQQLSLYDLPQVWYNPHTWDGFWEKACGLARSWACYLL